MKIFNEKSNSIDSKEIFRILLNFISNSKQMNWFAGYKWRWFKDYINEVLNDFNEIFYYSIDKFFGYLSYSIFHIIRLNWVLRMAFEKLEHIKALRIRKDNVNNNEVYLAGLLWLMLILNVYYPYECTHMKFHISSKKWTII